MKDNNMKKDKQLKGKKIILNPEGDQVIIDPEKTQDVKEATAVLSFQQRRQKAIAMRRRMPKIQRARELAVKRLAGKSKIKRRSGRLARKFLKRRAAGYIGASYQNLNTSQKIAVDRMVASKSGASRAIAARLVPRVRSAEGQRVSSGKRASTYNMRPITASREHPDLSLIEAVSHVIGVNEDLRNWFNPKHPEGGWKRINSKGEVVGPCAREPGEPKPKCMSNEKIAKLSRIQRAAAVAAKRREDPVADRPGKGSKPINVSNFGKGRITEEVVVLDEKNKPTNPELWSRAKSLARSKFDVYPSAYANGWAAKWYKSKGGGWKYVSESLLEDYKVWKNDEPVKYAKHLEKFFGKPDELTDHRVVWYDKDGFKRIEVLDEYILHASPAPHYDFCYCYIDLKVPHDLAKSLAESSESIIIDFLKNEVGARCASLSANAVTLNYCLDVVENRVKPSKKEYERRIEEMKNMFSRGKRYELDWWPDVTKDTDPKNKYYMSESYGQNESKTIASELIKKSHSKGGSPGTLKAKIDGPITLEKIRALKNSTKATPLDKKQANFYMNMHSESYIKKTAAQKLLDAIKRIEARKKPLPPPANQDKPK
jgi:hypothetical protein